jgi:DNA methylase
VPHHQPSACCSRSGPNTSMALRTRRAALSGVAAAALPVDLAKPLAQQAEISGAAVGEPLDQPSPQPHATTRHRRQTPARKAAGQAAAGRLSAAEVRPVRPRGDRRAAVRHWPLPIRSPEGPQPRRRVGHPDPPYLGPHFAAFPIDIPIRCIQAGCKPGGVVLDMFCGTGTTGLAAVALGRSFIGVELSPAFAALAAERLRQATAPTATRQHRRWRFFVIRILPPRN